MSILAVHRRPLLLALLLALLLPGAPGVQQARAWGNGQIASLVLGQHAFAITNDVAANQLKFGGQSDVAVDPTTGAVFVVDTGHSRVLRFDSTTSYRNGAAADGVLGQPDFTSSGIATSAYRLRGPTGATVDQAGRLWISDSWNNRVLRFDNAASLPNGSPASAVLGQPDFNSSAAALGVRGMNVPQGLTLDQQGRLWVADTRNGRVLRFDNAAGLPNGAPASAVLGQPNFIQHLEGHSDERLEGVMDVAVDGAGRLWVADSCRVLRFDNAASKPNGGPADGVLGQPDFTTCSGSLGSQGLWWATAVAVDEAGRLWVGEYRNGRVLRFDNAASKPNGGPADGVLGHSTFTEEHSTAPTLLAQPRGVAVDRASGKVFVADTENHRVLRFPSFAALSSGAAAEGVLGQPYLTTHAPANDAAGMRTPTALAVDGAGRLWVVDTGNHRVLRFDSAASLPDGAAAAGVLGQPDFISVTPTTSAQGLRAPAGVAVDAAGRLWVADADNHRVLRFDGAAGLPNGAAATGVLGQSDFTSATVLITAQRMFRPAGVTVDAAGRLWVADTNNHRVLRFDGAAGLPNGAAAAGVLGQPDFTSSEATTTATGFSHPRSLVIDDNGRLWVVDTDNHRVLRFDNAASKPNRSVANGVLGQDDFTSATAAISSRNLSAPMGVVVDAAGQVWIADTNNNRVLRFDEVPLLQALVRAVHATTKAGLATTSVLANGQPGATCLTSGDGSCTLTGLPSGTYTLALNKTDNVAGIGAYDASLILQHASAQRTLVGAALQAADTNGDAQVSAADASLVLQYAAGLRVLPFPAGKVWMFTPPPLQAIKQDQEIIVPGVLVGDVSGHLTPGKQSWRTAEVGALGALQLVQLGRPDAQGWRTVELWLRPEGTTLVSLGAALRFDPALVTDVQVLAGTSTGASMAVGVAPEGLIRVALASAEPLPPGRVLALRYRSAEPGGLALEQAETNDGGAPVWQPIVVQDWLQHLPQIRR